MHRWFMIIYGNLQVELMETKHNGHIHIVGNIVVYVSKPIHNNNQTF